MPLADETGPPLPERIDRTVRVIRGRWRDDPEIGIVLGTGLGGLADRLELEVSFGYEELPGFAVPTVEMHKGRLLLGKLADRRVVVMQGRFHRYEGYSLEQVTFPIRVMRALGVQTLVVSNVSGGMNPLWSPGELVLISDHINLLGDNPLIGRNWHELGPRFPDMSEPYDGELQRIALETALEKGIRLNRGVYVAVAGPNLETRAEYRMLRSMGADIVGMSTVPEVIVAVHGGMRVLGLSIITDSCLPDALQPANIQQILAVAGAAEPRLTELVEAVVSRIGRVRE
jgi:purine-nucleoside phosphorylase